MTDARERDPRRGPAPPLDPLGALRSPTWLLALVVLAVNDHALKRAGVLPGALTGKLSDVAGMLVAPALLAALLAVRTRRGALACHVAVGGVFAAIKLSTAAAAAWCGLLAAIGAPWTVVVDPTDLVALPALALSWRWLVPPMQRPSPAALRRLAAGAAAALGLVVCVATSPRRVPPPTPPLPPLPPDAVTVTFNARVEGTVELRCDDGHRLDAVVVDGNYVHLSPRPAAGAACKLQLLGLPGTFGPVTRDTRLVQCDARRSQLACWPGAPPP